MVVSWFCPFLSASTTSLTTSPTFLHLLNPSALPLSHYPHQCLLHPITPITSQRQRRLSAHSKHNLPSPFLHPSFELQVFITSLRLPHIVYSSHRYRSSFFTPHRLVAPAVGYGFILLFRNVLVEDCANPDSSSAYKRSPLMIILPRRWRLLDPQQTFSGPKAAGAVYGGSVGGAYG